jgi:hypothetical protein
MVVIPCIVKKIAISGINSFSILKPDISIPSLQFVMAVKRIFFPF